jgi:transcriptional regulator with XRE-family HTH domain
MDKKTRARLEAEGYWIGDAEDFLGLTPEERQMVELRLMMSRLVRGLRERHGLTQQELAKKMKSSQSRVAKIEAAEADVSLDLLFRALFAAGGDLGDVAANTHEPAKRAKRYAAKRQRRSTGAVIAPRHLSRPKVATVVR